MLALGSYSPANVKAELLGVERNTWVTTSDYPYVEDLKLFLLYHDKSLTTINLIKHWPFCSSRKDESHISHYSMLYLKNGFIVFGSYSSTSRSVIARLDLSTTSWIKLGHLKVGRYYHNTIYDGEVFIVVGGSSSAIATENCSLIDSTMTCTEQEPILSGYHVYPALLMVPEDFCAEIWN